MTLIDGLSHWNSRALDGSLRSARPGGDSQPVLSPLPGKNGTARSRGAGRGRERSRQTLDTPRLKCQFPLCPSRTSWNLLEPCPLWGSSPNCTSPFSPPNPMLPNPSINPSPTPNPRSPPFLGLKQLPIPASSQCLSFLSLPSRPQPRCPLLLEAFPDHHRQARFHTPLLCQPHCPHCSLRHPREGGRGPVRPSSRPRPGRGLPRGVLASGPTPPCKAPGTEEFHNPGPEQRGT